MCKKIQQQIKSGCYAVPLSKIQIIQVDKNKLKIAINRVLKSYTKNIKITKYQQVNNYSKHSN